MWNTVVTRVGLFAAWSVIHKQVEKKMLCISGILR